MSDSSNADTRDSVTIPFGQKYAESEQFKTVFREGMALVEETASYLDGDGRREAKVLTPPSSLAYATESMRLTTRLLDLASWLLIRRALKEGDISEAEAAKKRQRLKLQSLGRPGHIKNFGELPEALRGLIHESFQLHDRIITLDRAMTAEPVATELVAGNANPAEQHSEVARRPVARAAHVGRHHAPVVGRRIAQPRDKTLGLDKSTVNDWAAESGIAG